MSEDDKMVELAVAGKPLVHYSEEIVAEMDDFFEGDYLELLDLDIPTSPSSSSENSSCLTMSSDDDFDTMDVLCDAERDINQDRAQRDAACIRSSAASRLKKEVVHQGASGLSIYFSRPPVVYLPFYALLRIKSNLVRIGRQDRTFYYMVTESLWDMLFFSMYSKKRKTNSRRENYS